MDALQSLCLVEACEEIGLQMNVEIINCMMSRNIREWRR